MTYSLYNYLFFFIIYSFLGWCMEVIYQTIKLRSFVNRGFLHGPICPIYGFGVITVLYFLEPLKYNLLFLFLGSIIFTTTIELFTGFLLEKLFYIRWWDYSNNKYNYKGYICLFFSLAWGILCVFVINVLHPLINTIVSILPKQIGIIILSFSICLILIDTILTVLTILKFTKRLKRLNQIGQRLCVLSEHIGKYLSSETLELMEKSDKIKEDMYLESLAIKQLKDERIDKIKEDLQSELQMIKRLKDEKRDIWENHLMKFRYYEYYKLHPKIKFKKYEDIFEEFTQKLKKRKH